MTGVLIRRGEYNSEIPGRTCEDATRRQPYASQGESPQEKPILPHLDLDLPASRNVRKSIPVI